MSHDNGHYESLLTSSWLTKTQSKRFVSPLRALSLLERSNVPCLLLGLHGITGWMNRPRASLPVELLVSARHYRRAGKTLAASLPSLNRRDDGCSTNFVCAGYNARIELKQAEGASAQAPKPETSLIQLKRATPKNPLLGIAFRHAVSVRLRRGAYKIPAFELALALAFVAIIHSGNGWPDAYMAAHDFILMARSPNEIDWSRLRRVAGALRRPEARGLVDEVAHVRAGHKLRLL